jgi:Lhr-like helicase
MEHQVAKTKETANHLGIWMDHASAHLMDVTSDSIITNIISSKFTHQAKEEALSKGEKAMHNKEQHQQSDYYKKLAEIIQRYQEVIIFGPTSAKVELYNLLKADHHFDAIKINIKQAQKMTEPEEHAFVRKYFTGRFLIPPQ